MTVQRVSVRKLIEWVHRQGDIHFRYDRAVAPMEGAALHRRLAGQLGAEHEVSVSAEVKRDDWTLKISGRIDALDAQRGPPRLTEIKSTRTTLARLHAHAGHLHWAQAMAYGHLICEARGWLSVDLCLLYWHLDDEASEVHERRCTADALKTWFESTVDRYCDWLTAQRIYILQRNAHLRELAFPFTRFRSGQRQLAAACFRNVRDGGALVLEAPTGLGKTMGVLYPALRAIGEGHAQRLMFLTARGTGQRAAHDALARINDAATEPLRSVTLMAKEKVCRTPGAPCAADSCGYAKGYHDRAPHALSAVLARKLDVDGAATAFHVCPFELSLEVAQWSDVVVCDYNYVLDPFVRTQRLLGERNGQTVLVLDEVHQLTDRGRDMFTANLSTRRLRDAAAATSGSVRRAAKRMLKQVLALLADEEPETQVELNAAFELALQALHGALDPLLADDIGEALLQLWFDLFRWGEIGQYVHRGPFAHIVRREGRHDATLQRLCLDPRPLIEAALKPYGSVIAMSGTLPGDEPLGLPEEPVRQRFPTPFATDQLGVFVVDDLSVLFRDRDRTTQALATLIAAAVEERSGNYLVFLPSYAYADALCAALPADMPTLRQHPNMSDQERQAFLDAFQNDGVTRVGIATTGGMFGESVDLSGDALIGVIIVGVALPPPSLARELIRTEQGYELAYQYPALTRVLQTAGRLIRSEDDRGILCLIDPRFRRYGWRRHFPAHWQPAFVHAAESAAAIAKFWNREQAVQCTPLLSPVLHKATHER